MLSLALLALTGCARHSFPESTLQVVEQVDLESYLGTWYEIGNFPMRFQEGCVGTTATYSLRDDGDVDVLNECLRDGEELVAEGKAWIVDEDTNARLKVQFFWPFAGDYWVIDLAEDYSYAVVGAPERDYLWILSRTPDLDDDTLGGILERLEDQGYELSGLVFTEQPEAGLE